MKFKCHYLDADGTAHETEINAIDRVLAERLFERQHPDCGLVSIELLDEEPETSGDGSLSWQVRETVERELPLVPALRALAEESDSRATRGKALQLANQLEQGQTLAQLAEAGQLPRAFELMATCERNGVPPARLMRQFLTDQREQSHQTWQLWGVLCYAVFLLLCVAAISLGLMILIVPGFKDVLVDFDVELPGLTLLVFSISDLVNNAFMFPLILIFLLLLAIVTVFWPVLPTSISSRLFAFVPWIGRTFYLQNLAGFAKSLSTFCRARIPLPQAMRQSASLAHDPYVVYGAISLSESLDEGQSLAQVRAPLPEIPWAAIDKIATASGPLAFAQMLWTMGEILAARARSRFAFIVALIEPVILVVTVVTIGFTLFSMFLPLIKLLNELS